MVINMMAARDFGRSFALGFVSLLLCQLLLLLLVLLVFACYSLHWCFKDLALQQGGGTSGGYIDHARKRDIDQLLF